ncbi:MAG TPA: RES family NAD+ phosphorylase [Bradyrhizobium sp.]|jgi:RES domain-containing protein|nr:RES family NAD+ phosphorylase [Bradyrhizobium sp.]
MRLWRLSSERRARDFDGGYGLWNDGRWNSRGRPVTYCSTVVSLTALEKRVHVSDPALLPPQALVAYEVPDGVSRRTIAIDDLPLDWTLRETHTQTIGDQWLDSQTEVLLFVPSVIVPIANVPDRNVLINHRAAEAAAIHIAQVIPFAFDPRLFAP